MLAAVKSSPERIEALCWELRRAFRDLAAAGDRALAPLGIQARDRAFLEFLAREREPVSLSALARKASVSRQHIQQTLRRLPDPEWIEQLGDPADHRAVRIRLSRRGRAMWKRIRVVDAAFFDRLAPAFADADVATALRVLGNLRARVSTMEERPT
jgi:DNA-binding MarR family transcriptional regulator